MLAGDLLIQNTRHFPKRTAIIDEIGFRCTHEEFNRRVNQLGNSLLAHGLGKGDRIGILSENRHQVCEFLFAAIKTGIIGAGYNYRLKPAQVLNIIKDSSPRIIFVQDKFLDSINAVLDELPFVERVIVFGGSEDSYEEFLAAGSPEEPLVELCEDDIALLTYTSGSTSDPKGVMMNHRNIYYGCQLEKLAARFGAEDVVMLGAPLFTGGARFKFFAASYSGCTQVIHVFTGESFAHLVPKEKVTSTSLIPTRFNIIRKFIAEHPATYDFSSLNKIPIGGGQRTSIQQIEEILSYFKVDFSNVIYGMTESSGGPIAVLMPETLRDILRSKWDANRIPPVGNAVLDGRIRIVDADDNDVPAGETGEIIAKGSTITPGYWRKDEETRRVMRGGWYHTSDLGRFDEENRLCFVGRKDFLIKTGGFFVSPEEVESVISQHEAVSQVIVIGVPDEKWGQAIKTIIVTKMGCKVSAEEIREFCRPFLSGFQIPKTVEFVDDLPVDGSMMKISYKEVRSRFS